MLRLSNLCKARVQLLQVRVRYNTTDAAAVVTEKSKESLEAISKRKAFRAIDLDMKIMDRLDTMNVGFLPKRKTRVAVAQKFDPNSHRYKEERIEEEKRIPFPFRGTGKMLNIATTKLEIPHIKGSPPEIALIGRSNVGKSTLLNTLLSFDSSYVQKAAVSDKPGETTHLTFYQIGSSYKPPAKMAATPADPAFADEPDKMFKTPALVLTDMPGYGFAFMSEAEKMRCHMLCLDYLVSNIDRNRVLKRVVLLLDGRHGLKASDVMFLQDLQRHLIEKVVALGGPDSRELMNILPTPAVAPNSSDADYNTVMPPDITLTNKATKVLSRHLGWKLQLVLTKCDLVDRPELCRRITDVSRTLSEKLPALYHSMLPTLALSAQEKKGVAEMQRDIAALVPPRWEEDPDIKRYDKTGALIPKKVAQPVHNHNRAKHTIPSTSESKLGRFGIFEKSHEPKKVYPDRPSFAERRLQRVEENKLKATLSLTASGVDGPNQKRLSFGERVKERRTALLPATSTSADAKKVPEETPLRGQNARRRHFDDYAEEIEEYFGDQLGDEGDDLLDSDFEEGDDDLEDFDSDFDEDPDDIGVNWRAAGEQFDSFSDEEDEILKEAQLAGEMGGYRSKGPSEETRQIVLGRRKALAREAKGDQGALVKGKRTVPFSKKGNNPGGIQRTKVNGQWRVPKTPSNPKGRHRYAKPVGRVDKRGRPEKKNGVARSSGFQNGNKAGAKSGFKSDSKSGPKGGAKSGFKSKPSSTGGKKVPPKGEQSGRRKYY